MGRIHGHLRRRDSNHHPLNYVKHYNRHNRNRDVPHGCFVGNLPISQNPS